MIKFLILFLMISVKAFAVDSVKVESKIYTAPFSDEYRTDTAQYKLPVITGGADANLLARLNSYLATDSLLFDNIDTVIANYAFCGCGTVGADYNVLYNKNSVLSISVQIETMGAYPDEYYKDVNLNLTTGSRILISHLIKKSKMPELAAELDKIVQNRIKAKVKEEQIGEEDALQFFEGKKFSTNNLEDFAFTDKGVMFYYNFNLPHVLKALSPDEDILMTWEEIEDYAREGSLLQKIIDKQ